MRAGVNDLERAEIAMLYARGLTMRQIATGVGRSLSAVHRALVASGEPARPRGSTRRIGPDDPRAIIAAELRRKGLSIRAIAKRMGVAQATAHRYLKRGHNA